MYACIKFPVYISHCYYKWTGQERSAWNRPLRPDGRCCPANSLGVLITFLKISPPLSRAWCEIPRVFANVMFSYPACVSVLVLPVMCEAVPDRSAPTPATGIWYRPYGRVGERHRFRLTEIHGRETGKEHVEIALMKVSTLKELKVSPNFEKDE